MWKGPVGGRGCVSRCFRINVWLCVGFGLVWWVGELGFRWGGDLRARYVLRMTMMRANYAENRWEDGKFG